MAQTMVEFIVEGVEAATTSDKHIDPYRVLNWLISHYPELGFRNLPTAQDIRDYIAELDNSRQFDKLGMGNYSFFVERKPTIENKIQPRAASHYKRGGQEVQNVPVRFNNGRFGSISR